MQVQPIFKWYDLWIGAFIDTEKKTAYVLPVPCFGFKITWHDHMWVQDTFSFEHLCTICEKRFKSWALKPTMGSKFRRRLSLFRMWFKYRRWRKQREFEYYAEAESWT